MRYTLIILAIFLFFSCGSKKVATKSEAAKETSEVVSSYALIVSFYSPGNGIDRKMITKYNEFLTSKYASVVVEKVKWGKEGEVDYCFQLKELKDDQKVQFVKESKELLAGSSRVHVYENAECKHKR